MNGMLRSTATAGLMLAVLPHCVTARVSAGSGPAGEFAPLNQWKSAVLAGDRAELKYLYSTSPALQVATARESGEGAAETDFWIGLKARKIDLDIIEKSSPRPDLRDIVFDAEVQSGEETRHVNEAQAWQQQGDNWRLLLVRHTPPAYLKQPATASKNIYPDNADAHPGNQRGRATRCERSQTSVAGFRRDLVLRLPRGRVGISSFRLLPRDDGL